MVTRKLITPGTSLAIGLVASLAAHQAAAAEELVVYATQAAVGIRSEQASIRADIEIYISSLNEQLRATLSQDLKLLPQRIEIATEDLRTRG